MFKKFGRWLVSMMGFVPMMAFADTSGPFTVPDSDISLKILAQIFGGLTSIGGKDAFGDAVSTFNGAVLIVGGILATYTLLAGTLGTAHDGEMLGKKFSSVWIPIRYALGTALVLPVLTGGYCVMQQLVMWCILQGVGLANSVWVSYLSSPQLSAPVYMTTNHKNAVLEFANNVALAQICTQANASILSEGNSGGGLIDSIGKSIMTYDFKVAYNADNSKAFFGDQAGKLTLLTKASCGEANIPQKPAANRVITPTTATSSGGKLGDISSAFQLGDVSPVYQAHIDQSKKLITDMGTLAKSAVSADAPVKESDVVKAADAYVKGVESAANTYSNGNNTPFAGIIAASKSQGWILAGAWFTKLAMMNQSLNDAVNSIPTASYTSQLGSGFKFLDAIQPKIGIARTEILEAMNVSLPDSDSDEKDDSKGKQTQSSSAWSKIVQSVVHVFTGLDLENLQNGNKHPVLVLQDAGNRMISAWSWSATALMGVLAITGISVLGNHFDAGPIVITFIGFAFLPIAGLVTLGFTLAYLLPNLPFLMWIGIVLGWLIMCVEAILAAPLWAVMHLHPNGDDLTGRGGNGYMLLLGLLLRPALTIFGLIAALVLTELMGEFVNKIFFAVFFSGSSAGWGTGLVTILSVVFSMTVYTSAMVQLFRKTFSLMHVIPDQLMRWIGGGQEQMGQYAGGLAEAGQKGVQAAGQAGSFLGERTANTAGQMINQAKSIKDQRAQQQAREAAMNSEEQSVLENFSNSGMGEGEVNTMQRRTESADKSLSAAHPQSKAGIELAQSKGKMLKSRGEGESKVSQMAGKEGTSAYLTALSTGQIQVGPNEFKTIGQFGGNNDFEREANFASFAANTIISQSTTQKEAEAQQQQVTSSQRHTEQMSALQGIKEGVANSGKTKDSSSTPQGGESIRNGGSAKQTNSNQFDLFDPVQGDLFGSQHDNIVNNAFQTDKDGNLLNPALAQTLVSSGVVNPAGRGMNVNSANMIQHGGHSNAPVQTPVDPAAMSAESKPAPSIGDFTPEVSSRNNQIESGVDSSTNAQFQFPSFDSPNTEGLSPSQSFDGSGGSQTGSNPPISDIDR